MSTSTRDKFVAFLQDKKTNPVCELCGHNNWMIPDGKSGIVNLPIPSEDGSFVIPPPSVPALLMVCNNCGNIRFHAAGLIDPSVLSGGKNG